MEGMFYKLPRRNGIIYQTGETYLQIKYME